MLRFGILALPALLLALIAPSNAEDLFKSRRVTPPGEYSFAIEGAASDRQGAIYVANLRMTGRLRLRSTIGVLKPGASKSALFVTLPAGSVGNGIRFDKAGVMYVVDYKTHTIFSFAPGSTTRAVYFQDAGFTQPNDIALGNDGSLYLSDPKFSAGTGRIWLVARGPDGKVHGAPMTADRPMGTTNGLDVSPDGKTLYVGESATREIWAYDIQGSHLASARLVRKLDRGEVDGLRTDADGRVFVTNPGAGTVVVLSPQGEIVQEVALNGANPTNLTFGGPDDKTVFVDQRSGGFIEAFRSDTRGREPLE